MGAVSCVQGSVLWVLTRWTFPKAISPTSWAPNSHRTPVSREVAMAVSTPRAKSRRWLDAGGSSVWVITPGLALFDYLSFLTSRHRSGPSTSTRSEFLRMREPPQASEDRRRHASATLRGCCGAVERASAARAFEGECQTWGRFLLHHGEHDLFFFASSTSSSCAEEAQVWGAFGRQRHVAVLLGNGPDHAAVGSGVGPFRRPSRRSIPGPGVEQGPAAVESVVEV